MTQKQTVGAKKTNRQTHKKDIDKQTDKNRHIHI